MKNFYFKADYSLARLNNIYWVSSRVGFISVKNRGEKKHHWWLETNASIKPKWSKTNQDPKWILTYFFSTKICLICLSLIFFFQPTVRLRKKSCNYPDILCRLYKFIIDYVNNELKWLNKDWLPIIISFLHLNPTLKQLFQIKTLYSFFSFSFMQQEQWDIIRELWPFLNLTNLSYDFVMK